MGSTAAAIIDVAKKEVGYHEGRKGGDWDNIQKYSTGVPSLTWSQGQAWCATFVSWCALESKNSDLFPCTASCAEGVEWFKKEGRFSEYPAVGAQVFYGAGGGAHTGIVVSYDADNIHTVEGNTNTNGSAEGDGVYAKTRARRDTYVYGYGYPKYAAGIASADPRYMAEAPKPSTGSTSKPSAPAKPSTPAKPAAKPSVSLSHVIAAAKADPHAAQGHATHAADVKLVEEALKAEGLLDAKYASDGSYGSLTVAAYSAWQKRYAKTHGLAWSGTDVNGIPGKTSLAGLGAKHGFTVKA